MVAPLKTPSLAERADAQRSRRGRLLPRLLEAAGIGGEICLVIPAGLAVSIDGTDSHHPCRVHDTFRYLSGWDECGAILLAAPSHAAKEWILLRPRPAPEDLLWTGKPPGDQEVASMTGLVEIGDRRDLPRYLDGAVVTWAGSRDLLEKPGGYDLHPEHLRRLSLDVAASSRIEQALVEARTQKDALELALLQRAIDASIAGHRRAALAARPGRSEREVSLEIEMEMRREGAEAMAYAPIVLAGSRGAVLHGRPGDHRLQAGMSLLVDAGGEVSGYDGDLTRVYPVGGRFSSEAADLYQVVLEAQRRAIAACVPGASFSELHRSAAACLAEGLVGLGVLRCSAEEAVSSAAIALFFPHGLGHLLGLATHDVGGLPGGVPPGELFARLRLNRGLRPDFVLTVEPGLYFPEESLIDPALRERHHRRVNWRRAATFRSTGGVRIEDDVRITRAGCEVLSENLPRTLGEIEALCPSES